MFGGHKDASGSLWTLLETTGINRDGPWRRSRILKLSADIHGYTRRCIRTIVTGFTDDKDASRTILGWGLRIHFQFHTTLRNLGNGALSCTKAYIRDTWLGFFFIHFLQFDVNTSAGTS